jgi:oligopeptidase A
LANPILRRDRLVAFPEITPDHVVPAITAALAEAETAIQKVIDLEGQRTYANTIATLDDAMDALERVLAPVVHLTLVDDSPELRRAYAEVEPAFTALYARISRDQGIWHAFHAFAETPEAAALTGIRRRNLERKLRDMRLAGADLPEHDRAHLEEIEVELSALATNFRDNLLDATNAFALDITAESDLAGLTPDAITQARAQAEEAGIEGWRFTLHQPSYIAFMTHSERRELRHALHQAYNNRASAGETDNRATITRTLELRAEAARILGCDSYADHTLRDRMAGSGDRARTFTAELEELTRTHFERESTELADFARTLGIDELQPWDTAFVAERMRRERHGFDEEILRPYLPLDRVLAGLFEVARRLYGITVTERPAPEAWHPEVRAFEILDDAGRAMTTFYADLHPRATKRDGAWFDSLRHARYHDDGTREPGVGLIVANFTPPTGDRPALLTHREVETIFHEFGHLLHFALSEVEVPSLAGTNVSRDFVELPSQIHENWCWEPEAVPLFSAHYQTGEPIPAELLEALLGTRRYRAASAQMRQLGFAAVDLALHSTNGPFTPEGVIETAREVVGRHSIRTDFADDHFICSFSHIFAGGYSARYYSYKWSEMLDADAFTRFKNEGLFNRETGRDFVETILARGDAEEPDTLFREFMGRKPDPKALVDRTIEGLRDRQQVH